jgi:hypothetical protein
MQIDKQHNKSVKKIRNEYDHPPIKHQINQNKTKMVASERM